MPALPSSLIEPLWDQFAALIPPRVDTHPLGCHRPRIGDRIVFDKLIQVLVLGATHDRIEWISDGLFAELEDICLRAYDQIVGLDLGDVTVDGCIVKAPCGGEAAGKSPVDRGKLGTKRSLLVDSTGVPGEPARLPAAAPDPGQAGPLRRRTRGGPTGPDHGAPGRRL